MAYDLRNRVERAAVGLLDGRRFEGAASGFLHQVHGGPLIDDNGAGAAVNLTALLREVIDHRGAIDDFGIIDNHGGGPDTVAEMP